MHCKIQWYVRSDVVTENRAPGIDRTVEYRRLRWAGNVARIGRQGILTEFLRGNLLKNAHLED
jgi:hypothetical protein